MRLILGWLGRLWRLLTGADDPYQTIEVEGDLPKVLDRKTLYLVAEDGFLEHVSMVCPCGCGDIVHLNTLTDERPVWRVEEHPDRTVTIHPSIWRTNRCGAHYWVRRGRVFWCESVCAGAD